MDSQDADLLVARRLHALRHERGVTLTALAAQTGFSAAHLSRLEKGERQPSIAALLHLARVYGVPVSTLVDDQDGDSYHVVRSADAVTHHGNDGTYTILSGARAALAVVRLELPAARHSDIARHAATVLIASASATAPMQHPVPPRTASLPPEQLPSSG